MNFKSFRNKLKYIKEKTVLELPTVLSTGLANFDRDYLTVQSLSLREIFLRMNFLNSLFNSMLFYQIESENIETLRSESVIAAETLSSELKNNLEKQYEFFQRSKSNNSLRFTKLNMLQFSNENYIEEVYLDIPNFHFDFKNDYFFNLVIRKSDTIDFSLNTIQEIKIPVMPYRFSGKYYEKINFDNPIYSSKFEVNINDNITILDRDKSVLNNLTYSIDENQKIIFDIDQTTDKEIFLNYTPTMDSLKVKVDGYVQTIYLETNFGNDLNKNLIVIGDHNV